MGAPAMRSRPLTIVSARRLRQRRRQRGAAMVEYLALLVLVVLPTIAAASLGFARAYLWYGRFIRDVSQSTP